MQSVVGTETEYVFLVRHDGDSQIGTLMIDVRNDHDVSIHEDVPAGDRMWVEYTCMAFLQVPFDCQPVPGDFSSWRVRNAYKLAIHVRNIGDVPSK